MAIFGLINNVSVAVYNLAGFIDEKTLCSGFKIIF